MHFLQLETASPKAPPTILPPRTRCLSHLRSHGTARPQRTFPGSAAGGRSRLFAVSGAGLITRRRVVGIAKNNPPSKYDENHRLSQPRHPTAHALWARWCLLS